MNFIKVTNSGAIHFKLRDNRIGAIYPTGYVRVSTFQDNYYHKKRLMYQINKQDKKWYDKSKPWGFNIVRIKVPTLLDGFKMLQRFEENNCVNKENVTQESFQCNSEAIKMVEYNYGTLTLTVVFNSGKSYEYFDVPRKVYDDFKQSKSKGKFINTIIKKFKCRALTQAV